MPPSATPTPLLLLLLVVVVVVVVLWPAGVRADVGVSALAVHHPVPSSTMRSATMTRIWKHDWLR